MRRKSGKQIISPHVRFGASSRGPYANKIAGGTFAKTFNIGSCFRIVSAQIGDPWPDQIYITYNEDYNATTCGVLGDWDFRYEGVNFDNVQSLVGPSARTDAWLTRNTLEDKDGADPGDSVTLSYTPGTCAKDGDAECALEEITNRAVSNRILGPTSLEIGDFADDVIVVDYPVDMTSDGASGTWTVEDTGGEIAGVTESIVGGNIHLTLPSAGGETEDYFVTHNPTTTALGAQGIDGRYSYKYFGKTVDNNIDVTAPSVPQNLVATATGQTSINLVWDASTDNKSGVKEYVIYRASVEIDRVAHPTTTYDDTGLSPETLYTYTVSAVDNKDNESIESAPAFDTTWQPAPNVTVAEVGAVADNIVVVTFDREVVASNYSAGWSFTEDGGNKPIQSSAKTQATEVQFTLTTDVAVDTTVAYNYNASSGNYENTDGVAMGNQSGSVTNNVSDLPEFVAFAADQNSTIRALQVGTEPVSYTANAGRTYTDWEGLSKTAQANQIIFENAREVDNLWRLGGTRSDNTTGGGWSTAGGATIDGPNDITLQDSFGSTVFKTINLGSPVTNRSFRIRARVTGAFGTNIVLGLQAASPDFTNPGQDAHLCDGNANDISILANFTTETASSVRFRFVGTTANTGPESFTITDFCLEEVTGQANTNPGNYVSYGIIVNGQYQGAGVDGLAVFSDENGNTVDSNLVITEAPGTPLTTSWRALFQPPSADGPGMFEFSNFNLDTGSFVFDLTMASATAQGLINFANAEAGVASYDLTNQFQTDDGTNQANVDPSLSSNLGDTIRFSILYSTANGLRIGYKNITDGGAWVWDADSAAFDGSFASDNVFNVFFDLAAESTLRDLIYYIQDKGETYIETNY